MPPIAAGAVALALALDLSVAEFPERMHPVSLFGRAVAAADRDWTHPRSVGVAVAAGLPLAAAGVAGAAVALAAHVHPLVGGAAAGAVLFSSTSLRMLLGECRRVLAAAGTDLDAARDRLPALVGRETGGLSAGEVRSAAVESAAENLADGLVAPLLAFAAVAPWSLSAGAGAAAWVKAVNTADSVLGYRSKPVGWASARLDDAVMWIPARASAALVAVAALDPGALSRARPWVEAPPSPNSGWPMATLAAVLDVRLEKPGAYALGPGTELPSAADARRGVRVVGLAGALAFVGSGAIAWS